MLVDTEALLGELPEVESLEGELGRDLVYAFPKVEGDTLMFVTKVEVSEDGELIV